MANLRSSEWFAGDDEVALSHRVVMASVGYELDANNTKPIIGIADSSSELNPCNLPLRDFIPEIKRGIIEAGGIPLVFPVMSLGEDLMKPSAMLYRNMLSMEVEEYLRSYPIDGAVFRKIAMPLAVPAVITVIVLQFIQIWDDLLVGLLFIQDPNYRTITVGLGALSAGRVTDIPVLMAGSLISAIPAVVVYLIFQRQLVNGLTAGIGK